MKHCLIIPCSDKKADEALPAHELYKGALMDDVNKLDIQKVLATVNLFFLSAKHGLIAAEETIQPYDKIMPSTVAEQQLFAKQYKRKAANLLKNVVGDTVELYTVLSKDYQFTKSAAIKGK